MSDGMSVENSQYFIDSLQEYVLEPLSTASSLVAQERTEVEAERDALEEFADRVSSIDPVTAPLCAYGPDLASRSTADKFDHVRAAYRETFLSTPHQKQLRGKQLVNDVAQEFGPKFADGFRQSSSTKFTPAYKNALEAETRLAVASREEFLNTLADEAESIETSRIGLLRAAAPLDTTVIPRWHCESFSEKLNMVGEERQQTLQARECGPHLDDFSLCMYLYTDQPWKYPVLIGLARLRETITFGPDLDMETGISGISD